MAAAASKAGKAKSTLIPLGDRVVVEREESEQTTSGGILLRHKKFLLARCEACHNHGLMPFSPRSLLDRRPLVGKKYVLIVVDAR